MKHLLTMSTDRNILYSTEGVYTIVDPYGFTKSLFTIASALDFLWVRGMVHCRLLAV
jgi:hypothetical protein